jgi:hypothetical protein
MERWGLIGMYLFKFVNNHENYPAYGVLAGIPTT